MPSAGRIALATMAGLPELNPEDRELIPSLRALGIEARPVIWNGPEESWEHFDGCLIRSTWDYFHQGAEFLAWTERVAARTRLWNPAPLVRWNSHKSYLRDLETRGIAIVPTVFPGPNETLETILDRQGWDRVVFKPAVSGGSFRTHVVDRGSMPAAEPTYRELRREQDVLVQPYVEAVETTGERSLLFFGGEFSHAVLRAPSLATEKRITEGVPFVPSEAERAFGRQVLSVLDGVPLYARVDLVVGAHGTPQLMEAELIEPNLFLASHPGSAARLAALLRAELD